ncbi:thymidylate kinase [bacterium Unc6]|nr:thymidylate kinase [bacterium Unc6]
MRGGYLNFFGKPIPEIKPEDLKGYLFVVEGTDGSGRSTHIAMLTQWLEAKGYSTVNMGLNRSTLISTELSKAKVGNILDPRTFTLFYVTDFFDQLENIIIPNLKAGSIILADRYIYTLIARSLVRGLEKEWIENIFQIALVPDIVFYLKVSPSILVERNLMKQTLFDYWESGMDMRISTDIFTSFVKYQKMMQDEYMRMSKKYNFTTINANRPVRTVFNQLKKHIEEYIKWVSGDEKSGGNSLLCC